MLQREIFENTICRSRVLSSQIIKICLSIELGHHFIRPYIKLSDPVLKSRLSQLLPKLRLT